MNNNTSGTNQQGLTTNFNASNGNSTRFPQQAPTWDPSFSAFPWSVASTSAAAAATAIEAAAYFASAGQNFSGNGYSGGDFGSYPWAAAQWTGVDSRWQMPKIPNPPGSTLPLGTLGAHNMSLTLNPNRGSLGRRRRNLFAPQQVIELQRAFCKSNYLKPEDRDDLAKRTGLSAQQVKIWFQNSRYKYKQKTKDEERAKKQARKKSSDSHGSSSNSNSNENSPKSSNSGESTVKKEASKTGEVDSDDKETPPNFGKSNGRANLSATGAESPPDLKINHNYAAQYNHAMYQNFFPFQPQGYPTNTAAIGTNGYYNTPFYGDKPPPFF